MAGPIPLRVGDGLPEVRRLLREFDHRWTADRAGVCREALTWADELRSAAIIVNRHPTPGIAEQVWLDVATSVVSTSGGLYYLDQGQPRLSVALALLAIPLMFRSLRKLRLMLSDRRKLLDLAEAIEAALRTLAQGCR